VFRKVRGLICAQMEPRRSYWGLVYRREALLPTWRGWLLVAVLVGLLGLGFIHGIAPFLCVTAPVTNGLLVVEGWERDDALERVVAEFRSKPYGRLYVTGGPIEAGAYLSDYKTYAQRGAAILLSLGLTTNEVLAVPAPGAARDRTYNAAVALKTWFRGHGIDARELQVMTEGAHARRSRLLFQKAFGPTVKIGITSLPEPDIDRRHWWRTSLGFRSMVNETVAYLYARFLFRMEAGNS
jgi:hypothetical protein